MRKTQICQVGQMLNREERFSSCGQVNACGFLPYYPEFKKDFICSIKEKILEALEDEA